MALKSSTDRTSDNGELFKNELEWLISEMGRLARQEAGFHPKQSLKRTCVFQWTAAIAMEMDSTELAYWLMQLLPPLYKELVDEKKTAG